MYEGELEGKEVREMWHEDNDKRSDLNTVNMVTRRRKQMEKCEKERKKNREKAVRITGIMV